jgi:proline-specific peptidase
MPENFANINGIKICYEIAGKGNPIILIHGITAKKEDWICQFKSLSENFRIIRFDNRGAGASDRPNEPYTMELYAEDLKSLMNFLNVEKAHIIGNSLGGMIVQTFAIKYPEKTNKIVLINTLPYFISDPKGFDMYINGLISGYEASQKDPETAFFNGSTINFTRNFRKLMMENPKRKFYDLFSAEDLIRESKNRPATPQDIRNQGNTLKNYNIVKKLNQIKKETLIICSAKDRQCPCNMSEKIHKEIQSSKLIVVQDAAHEVIKEKAPVINNYIKDFLTD